MEDYEIIEKIKNGDESGINELYTKYSKQAYRTAYLITSNSYTAEDVIQETFVQSIKAIKTLKNPNSFKPWFYKILTRIAWKHAKNDTYCILVDEMADKTNTSACDEYFKNNKYDLLYEEINKLNEKLKTTIILFYFNEMSIKEISKTMGCLEGTVKSRLFTAKSKLRKSLNKEVLQWII